MRDEDTWFGFSHLEKYDFVNGKDYPIYEMEKKCSTPPTRSIYQHLPAILGLGTFVFWHIPMCQNSDRSGHQRPVAGGRWTSGNWVSILSMV